MYVYEAKTFEQEQALEKELLRRAQTEGDFPFIEAWRAARRENAAMARILDANLVKGQFRVVVSYRTPEPKEDGEYLHECEFYPGDLTIGKILGEVMMMIKKMKEKIG